MGRYRASTEIGGTFTDIAAYDEVAEGSRISAEAEARLTAAFGPDAWERRRRPDQ